MMTIEEKAKAYDEAIKRGLDYIKHTPATEMVTRQDIFDAIFPELAENKDEKIRKELTEFLKNASEGHLDISTPYKTFGKWLTWFEKQDEQKPKFNEGDWITNGQLTCKVLKVTSKSYELHLYNDDYCHFETDIQSINKDYHLWSIADAKDGDIIVYGDNPDDCHVEIIMLFKSIRNENSVFTHFHIYDDEYRVNDWCDCGKNVHPATKKQCNTLIKAIDNANYIWNADKKELKIEPQFHKGDWIISKYMHLVMQIIDNDNGYYKTVEIDGTERNDSYDFIERNFKLWSMKDVKDGDILSNGQIVVIFKQFEEPAYREHIIAYVGLDNTGDIQITNGTWQLGSDKGHPATKEQRDLLFTRMKELGCKFNNDTKKIEVIDNNNELPDNLEWIDMETNECHCYSCELFDRNNNKCKNIELCKNPKSTYKGFYIN